MGVSQGSAGPLHRRPMLWGGVVTAFLILGTAGCASPTGNSPIAGLFPGSDEAALREAVANDTFPTAAQAGIASQVSDE